MALYSACRHQREKNNYFISLNRRLHMMTPGMFCQLITYCLLNLY